MLTYVMLKDKCALFTIRKHPLELNASFLTVYSFIEKVCQVESYYSLKALQLLLQGYCDTALLMFFLYAFKKMNNIFIYFITLYIICTHFVHTHIHSGCDYKILFKTWSKGHYFAAFRFCLSIRFTLETEDTD